MSRRTVVVMTDDMDGKPADETVRFGLDGVNYEIDLTDRNAEKLRSALAPFTAAARKIGRGGVTRIGAGRVGAVRASLYAGPARVGATGYTKDQNKAVRDWAVKSGMEVAFRGRIARDVYDAYEAAHRPSAA